MSMINDEILSLEEFIYQLKTWKNGWIQHLWFLQQLFIIYLLLLFIKPSFDHRPNAVKTFLAIFSILTIGNGTMTMIANIISIKSVGTLFSASFYNFFNNFHPFPSSRGGMLFYFLLGGLIASSIRKELCSKPPLFVTAIVLILSMSCNYLYGMYISLVSQEIFNIVGNNYFSPFTALNVICFYSISLRLGCYCLKRNGILTKLLVLISKNTLGIYLIHMPVGKLMDRYIGSYFKGGLFLTCVHSILLLIVSLVIVLCAKKIPIVKKLYIL